MFVREDEFICVSVCVSVYVCLRGTMCMCVFIFLSMLCVCVCVCSCDQVYEITIKDTRSTTQCATSNDAKTYMIIRDITIQYKA